jgi:hypothetical protein
LQCIVGVRSSQIVEDRRGFAQQFTGQFQSIDGVLKCHRIGVAGDSLDLGQMLLKGLVERRAIMLRTDVGKGRNLKRGLPVLEERIAGHKGLKVRRVLGGCGWQNSFGKNYAPAFSKIPIASGIIRTRSSLGTAPEIKKC